PSAVGSRCPSMAIGIAMLSFASSATALTPLADFNAQRYLGKWYEIAAMPGAFRNQCARDVQVDYSLEDSGALIVRNQCLRPDGTTLQSEGRGRILDGGVPAVLKVTFVQGLGLWWYPFGRNQTVIAAGRRGEWLVIGDPSLHYGRVLAREPTLDDAALRVVDAALAAESYDRCAFVIKPQAGGRNQLRRLCDEIRAP
ncbi:MAG TPA: lipocalin family protein, partial [Casimicrobiaceae bacterium]|nr:lipocalin family protein [Casimicrobiaceae bacterium]